MRGLLLLSAFGVLSSLAAPAVAQDTDQNRQACNGSEPAYSLAQRVAGCTALINAGTATTAVLAIAFYNRGIAYQGQNQYARAIADYDQAIRLKPDYALAFDNRGIAYFLQGKYSRAIADYDQALRLDGSNADYYYDRGVAELRLGLSAKGQADIARAIKANPNVAAERAERGVKP